jgi:hypothetical protein
MQPFPKMELAALTIGTVALIISVMALPTALQMFWGRPRVRIEFSSWENPKRLVCELHYVPIANPILWRLGVRREAAPVAAYFTIFEDGTNRVILDTARARLFDPTENNTEGGFRANLVNDAPLSFVCLAHLSDRGAVAMGSLRGETPVTLGVGRYLVGVRVICGDTNFSKGRLMTVGTAPAFTDWLAL